MIDEDARKIAQDTLDQQAADTERGDVEATLGWCDLPCTLESAEGRVVIEDWDHMRKVCEDFIAQLATRALTHMVRRVFEASFRDPDTVMATYETRFIKNGQVLEENPYTGFVILRRRQTGWKISNMQFTSTPDSPTSATLREQ